MLGKGVETSIETADGSLKLTLTAFAGIAGLLGGAVLKYPEFRTSVKAIYEDSRMLAEATNLETIFVTRTPTCDRIYSEARTGVIGKTARVVTSLDSLAVSLTTLRAPTNKAEVIRIDQASQTIARLDGEASRILEKVTSDEDRFCLAHGLHQAFKQLPETLPAETELSNSSLKKAMLKQQQLDFLTISAFQRYTIAVKSAKEALQKVGVSSQPKPT